MTTGDRFIYLGNVATIICTELHSTDENGKQSGKAIVYSVDGRLDEAVFIEDFDNITEEELLQMTGDMILEPYTGDKQWGPI